MVEIDITYEGDLHCRAVHGPSKSVIVTDAPVDNQGKGEAFSPTDLFATSLGVCILTIMGIFARNRGIDMSGARAKVVKEMISDPARRVGRLGVTIDLPARIPQEQRAPLERAGHACPVHRSLRPDVRVEIEFRYVP